MDYSLKNWPVFFNVLSLCFGKIDEIWLRFVTRSSQFNLDVTVCVS